MTDVTAAANLLQLVAERVELERKLQNERELRDAKVSEYDRSFRELQKKLVHHFRETTAPQGRVTAMVELIRLLENRLVYLQNFTIDPSAENRGLASLASDFLDGLAQEQSGVLTPLETMYFRGIAALYAGAPAAARDAFRAACASEESDEANDIKFKSYVILGNLSHVEHEYGEALAMHDSSLRYSQSNNVTAQALAFKALNEYALGEKEEAAALFEKSLSLFNPDEPFFNAYFHRNALLFCGLIAFERRDLGAAEGFYRRVIEDVDDDSFDYFDALARLGQIYYATGRFDDAAASFGRAIDSHRCGENEYLIDTCFRLARTQLRRNRPEEARVLLRRVADSEVRYDKREQAIELLRRAE
ncbi:MAG: tetratricopeptide repeat protein [Thermoanaerobaculia bacterium]